MAGALKCAGRTEVNAWIYFILVVVGDDVLSFKLKRTHRKQ